MVPGLVDKVLCQCSYRTVPVSNVIQIRVRASRYFELKNGFVTLIRRGANVSTEPLSGPIHHEGPRGPTCTVGRRNNGPVRWKASDRSHLPNSFRATGASEPWSYPHLLPGTISSTVKTQYRKLSSNPPSGISTEITV